MKYIIQYGNHVTSPMSKEGIEEHVRLFEKDVIVMWKIKEKRKFINIDTSTSSAMNKPMKFEKWLFGRWL